MIGPGAESQRGSFRDDDDAAARAAGARSELHLYEGAPHGFFNKNRSERWFAETMEHMDAFLVSLGWMDARLASRAEATDE